MRKAGLLFALAAALLLPLARCRMRPRTDYGALESERHLTETSGLDVFPSFSPDGLSVACARDVSGAFEIHVMSLSGTSDVAVTSDGKQNVQPSFSPDGRFIAYHSKGRGGIWVVPASGGAPRPLADFGSKPAFSPEGDLVAFQSENLTDFLAVGALPPSTIWVVPARGGPARDVTRASVPAGGHGSPTFTRDGKRIFFVATDPKFDASTLYSVGVDGKGMTRHVSLPRLFDPVVAPDGETVLISGGSAQRGYDLFRVALSGREAAKPPVALHVTGVDIPRHLTLSPDGRRLVFAGVTTVGNIWSQPLDPKTQLAAGPPHPLTHGGRARSTWPFPSPDGKTIVFGRQEPGASQDVWVMDRDGGNPRPLVAGPANDVARGWFPSGKALFLTSNRSGEERVYSFDLDRREATLLPISTKDMAYPRLSPDGRRLVYGSRQGGSTLNTWVMDVASGRAEAITFDREFFGYPFWSPDGKVIGAQVERGDDFHIAVVPASGGDPTQLTFQSGLAWPFSFSPDSDKIAFAGYRQGYWNVWWVSRATREEKRLTSFEKLNAFVRYPSWSPSGDQIVFEYAEGTGNLRVVEFGAR
ncbi:MAG TPA: hypothetical protein VGR00_03935 [Thermoanaerobaculia bacterium]|nr:hypothetical protein [Thermoanaerobaculia bacterium]